MAISEPLLASKQFNAYIRLALRLRASLQRVPNLLCQSSLRRAVIRTPVAPADAFNDVFPAPCQYCLRCNSKTLDSHICPRQSRSNEDVFSKLQCSLNATARTLCLPCSGQDFYFRAFTGRVAPVPASDMT